MAAISVILMGIPSGQVQDIGDTPVVLQFDEDGDYDNALWIVPGFPQELPSYMLSEIRVEQGPLQIMIEGPEGFASGPHTTDWLRTDYPRGKLFSLIQKSADPRTMSGKMATIEEGKLVLADLKVGGAASTTEPPASS
jgi:hypothetical protein